MHSTLFVAALIAAPLAVLGHGQTHRVDSGGVGQDGPNIYYDSDPKNAQTSVRKMFKADASGKAFLLPSDFSNPNLMSCEGAGPAPKSLKVAAGSSMTIHWEGATKELMGIGGITAYNPWVHAMGTVIDYITACNGNCSSFDPTNAGWTKLAGAGIDMGSSISGALRTAMTNKPEKYYPLGAGKWAMAKMVEEGSSWNINIPQSLKSGEYIVRHEIAALHNPLNSDPTTGPQVYVTCVNIVVTGGGSTTLPAGTKSSNLYTSDGAFAKFNVYHDDISSFKVPGPAVWDGATGGDSSPAPAPAPAPASDKPKPAPAAPKNTPADSKPAPSSQDSNPAPASNPKAGPGQCKRSNKRSLAERSPRVHKRNARARRSLH